MSGNATTGRKGNTAMSGAIWCDKGEHAFSAKDPDKQHFTKTQSVDVMTGNSYGQPTYQPRQEIVEELDICGPCWKSGNDFAAKQINGPKDPATKTLDELEKDDEQYRAGYEAAMEKVLAGKVDTPNG